MNSKITSRPISLIIALIFIFAAAIVTWKIIADGSTTQRLISAIGFAVAGILWIIILFRGNKKTN